MLHHIQRSVLDKLATSERLLYSELKPSDMDGNVFGYHLKSLLAGQYIAKSDDGGYCLLSKGRDYIIKRYEDPSRSAHSIFLIVVKNSDDKYLLRKRLVQPMLGHTGFIHGEPDPEKSIIETANERLFDKTGLDIELEIKGSALISQYVDDELHSYSSATILYGETDETDIKITDDTGKNFWSSIDSVENLLPSCHDIIDMIERRSVWFEKSYKM